MDTATETKTVAGETNLQGLPQEAKGLLAKNMAYLERQGFYNKSSYLKLLKILVKDGANLLDPEDVKTKIAQHRFKNKNDELQPWKNTVRNLAVYGYDNFCTMQGITWTKPKYRNEETEYFCPEEKHLDMLIAGTRSHRMVAYLCCLKETWADPGEALRIEWKDIQNNTIAINHPVKGHRSGSIEVTPKLISMINALPKNSNRIFPMTYQSTVNSFQKIRKRLAKIH